MLELDPIEARVLGCLLEKQRTTPDAYPLSLNSLRLACNQLTNRDPVVNYDEETVELALQRMHTRELTRIAGGHSSRATKYRHLLEDKMGITSDDGAVLCVLLLRGDQTPGELKQRTDRMHKFDDLEDLGDTLESLQRRQLVKRLERRPGEKQVRYRHLLGANDMDVLAGVAPDAVGDDFNPGRWSDDQDASTTSHMPGADATIDTTNTDDLRADVERLKVEVAELRAELQQLRDRQLVD